MPHSSKPAGGRGAVVAAFQAYRQQGIPLRFVPTLLRANHEFDCPGCAFPDKPGGALVDSCEQGQKAMAWEMTRRATGADFFAGKTPQDLQALSDYELENQGRLTQPMLYERARNRFRPVSWDEAFALIGHELGALAPQQAAFYASGRSSNEAAFLWQLAARAYGCANLPDSSNFCHEPSGYALKQAIGVGKGTCTLDDFARADLIIVMGQNPASNHPRMMVALAEAAQRGATVVAVNPLRERGFTHFTDPKHLGQMLTGRGSAVARHLYQVRPGGDLALLQGMMKALLEQEVAHGGVLNHDFIAEHCTGLEPLQAQLAGLDWTALEHDAGVDQAAMRELAALYAASGATMITWCMGITHHHHAVDTIRQIANLLLLRGNIGRPGAGAMPVRGHSNVQGDRTMGATSSVPPRWLDNLEASFPGLEPCRNAGRDALQVIDGLLDGSVRAFLGLGGNFGVAAPDSPRVLQALSRCRLTVHIATKLNRTHCHPGELGLLLPTLGRTDQDLSAGRLQMVTTEDSTGVVRTSRGVQPPLAAAGQWSEPVIVARIGEAIARQPGAVPWRELADDYARIRAAIARCQQGVFDGFDGFERMVAGERRPLPNSAAARRWRTASGKAEFAVAREGQDGPLQQARARYGDEVLALVTLRSHDQFNTTVYGHDDRYRDVFGTRRVLLLHPDELAARGLKEGDELRVETVADDGVERVLCLEARAFDVARGCAAAYFPEATPLVPLAHASLDTRTPAYKEVPVKVSLLS